jgi:hypothetical protein
LEQARDLKLSGKWPIDVWRDFEMLTISYPMVKVTLALTVKM